MPIYDKPTKELMFEWAKEHLQPGEIFSKAQPVAWFKQHYPDIKSNTVEMHVEGMSVNNRNRRHHANIRPGSGHDLFWKEGANRFRLWVQDEDPAPRYKPEIDKELAGDDGVSIDDDCDEDAGQDIEAGAAFAFEKDLQNYLARNLHVLEPGLRLYQEEGLDGIEYSAGGGRRIDILAVDQADTFVVIELKVSKGYDRVIGQLLRYIGWVESNLSPDREVRGIIVAKEISEDLIFATRRLGNVKLFEYEIAFSVGQVARET